MGCSCRAVFACALAYWRAFVALVRFGLRLARTISLSPTPLLARGEDYRPPFAFAASLSRVLRAARPPPFLPYGQPSKSPLAASLRFGLGAPSPLAPVK